MAAVRVDLPQGTLETMILKTLTWGPNHGFAIGRWIERASNDTLVIEEGSLYPALYRMEKRGWIEPEWRTTENNRRAKYYALTAAGRKQFREQTKNWSQLVTSVSLVFDATKP
jgi:transcriptional regulator